jgi:hypothetical protein
MDNVENVQSVEAVRGSRGAFVGELTASGKIKQLHRAQTTGKRMSLKAFARSLTGDNTELARTWMECKHGALNQERSDSNKNRILLENQAKKNARMSNKKKEGSKSKDVGPSTIVTKSIK